MLCCFRGAAVVFFVGCLLVFVGDDVGFVVGLFVVVGGVALVF